ncbi:MAG TPA: tetratricopeptide repeat protein [Acidobacteriaceae bacterium]|jgi:tetratricopeptide (TPR) repeat protein
MRSVSRFFVPLSAVTLTLAVLQPAWTAAQVSSRVQASASSTPNVSITQGSIDESRRLIQTGHPEQALQALDKLAATSPSSPGLERTRGSALYGLNRLREAEAAFGRALEMDPHDQEAAQMRGLTLYQLGRPAEAIPFLEQFHGASAQVKADPTYVLALCYMDTRRYDDARRAFAAQYGVTTDSAASYLLTARMLLRREYLPIAQTFAERGIALEPKLPLAHSLLGEIALAQNRTDDAIQDFRKELEIDPLEGSTYERLGDAYSRAGRYTESQRVLQQAVLLQPNSTGPYILLGKVTLKQGDAVGAVTFLQRAESMDPGNFMTHNLLAQAYKALGRTADAARELELTQKTQAAQEPHLSTLK